MVFNAGGVCSHVSEQHPRHYRRLCRRRHTFGHSSQYAWACVLPTRISTNSLNLNPRALLFCAGKKPEKRSGVENVNSLLGTLKLFGTESEQIVVKPFQIEPEPIILVGTPPLVFSYGIASEFRFGLQRSTDWQFTGRKVQFNFTIDVPESTPLKAKIALPVKDGTAILRFTEVTSRIASEHLRPSSNTTTLTPSANDSLNVIALFDFGNVTRASFENSTEIKIDFEVQVMNHAHIVNGGTQWVSVGAEYKNQSVWVSQMAVKTINPASSRPDLMVELWPNLGGHNAITKNVIDLRLRLHHSDLTTEEVVSGIIEWPLPPVMSLYSCVKMASSVNVAVTNTTDMVTIKFGQLKFSETVDLTCTFHVDLHKTKQDGKIYDCTTHVNVRYNGSINTCSSSSGSREFTNNEPTTAFFKYYVKHSTCDEALGMTDGSIKNDQIAASSYPVGSEPHEGRLGGNAWIPDGELSKDKHQFLEVNFKGRVRIRRISMKGLSKYFVKSFLLYYSDDGVIWNPYKEGSKNKEFMANARGDYETQIILPLPFEAVFVRINPATWENSIALKVEFYGCSSNQPYIPGPLTFKSRGYLLDKSSDTMYVCSVPMESKKQSSKCFFSSDQGSSWKGIHHGVLSLLGHDTVENVLYGVGLNGKAVLKSTTDHTEKFTAVPQNVWDAIKLKGTTNQAVMIGNNTTVTPTQVSGSKWGVSAQGIHVEQSSTWKLKAIWMCTALKIFQTSGRFGTETNPCGVNWLPTVRQLNGELFTFSVPGYVHVYICSSGMEDPVKPTCSTGKASIKVDGIERAVANGIGHKIVVLTRGGHFIVARSFDTHRYSTADDNMGSFIDSLPDHVIVLVAIADEGTWGGGVSESLKQGANQQLIALGAKNPRASGWRASWGLAGYKGPHDRVNWIRFAEAPRGTGPTEITVQIPKIFNGCA